MSATELHRQDDPRLNILLQRETTATQCLTKRVGIIGVPFEEGVALNGGRIGAKHGPQSVRKFLPKIGPIFNPEFGLDISGIHLSDFGDVSTKDSVQETHEQIEAKVYESLLNGFIPICVGGGNDQSYPNGKALFQYLQNTEIQRDSHKSMAVINIDAHLDVRKPIPGPHSGSPFRQLLEYTNYNMKLIEFASQGSQCSKEHADFVTESGGEIFWLSTIRNKTGGVLRAFQTLMDSLADYSVFFSFDIDSIASCDCPGVSCPGVIGITAQEALDICFEAGKRSTVVIMDISEFNPIVEEYRTGRLVANMIYYFLLGYSKR